MSTRCKLDRKTIVVAAAEIADSAGIDHVTLAAVANRLGVRKPSLYNHINGLPELRAQLAIWGTNQLRAKISEAAIGKAKHAAILAIASATSFARQSPGLYRAILSSPDRDNIELRDATQSLMAVIEKVMESYELVASDSIHAVRGLRSLMHGFVSLEAAGWFAMPVDREESYWRLVYTFIRGIESAPLILLWYAGQA